MRFLVTALFCLWATAASAQGFAVQDLSQVSADARAALGKRYQAEVRPKRVTLACPECPGHPMIDVLLGRQSDGTEERVRSGQTPVSQLEKQCQERNPACRIVALKVEPAVGWISRYPISGVLAGSTAIVLKDGDSLTIRSVASDGAVAQANAEKLVGAIVSKVVGR